jgi:transposase
MGIDATTLEANAALRSIVRRDTGEGYREFLVGLARESGIETPTREDLAKIDRKRKRKGSNDDWTSPSDPDAGISKMPGASAPDVGPTHRVGKDGRTRLCHKAEHAVDMASGAVVAVTLHRGEAVYSNRRRIRSSRGKRLLRKRGELLERAFTHYAPDAPAAA